MDTTIRYAVATRDMIYVSLPTFSPDLNVIENGYLQHLRNSDSFWLNVVERNPVSKSTDDRFIKSANKPV